MKKCPNCNAMMEDDALFCGECGTKFEVEDVSDQVEETAIPLEKKCIHCGESIEEDSAFCPFCGKPQTVEEVMPIEEVKKAPKKETIRNEVQKPKPLHEEPIENGRVIEVPDFTNEVIENNTSRTNRWIWAILLLIGLIGGAWYYYSQQNRGYSSSGEATAIDTTLVDTTLVDDNMSNYSNARDFLEQFYKGENGDEGYIEQFVTANVLNKLKRDYEYDNCNDCLATWVFTAYPPGSNLFLEEGPIIKESKEEGKYSVLYTYYSQGQSGRIYKHRGLLFSVTQIDGKYRISDYELVMPDIVQKPSDLSEGKDGQYYLRDGRMFLHLEKTGPDILADFDFRDGAYVSATYYFNCQLDEENKFSSMVYYANGECVGKIEGILEEGVMNVNVGVDNKYRGSYGFILSDDENEND